MRVRSLDEAHARATEVIEQREGSQGTRDLRFVWLLGAEPNATYYFRSKGSDGLRTLWQVGPRGGVNRLWRLEAWQWEVLY